MDEEVNIAHYIDPGVETDADQTIIVTMSNFIGGYKPQELPPYEPWTWIYDENAVRTQGEYWGKFRE